MTKKYTQESVKTAEPSKTALTIVEGPLPNAQFQKDHESTAGIDRKIFFLRCQGHSFHKIAQILNEDGDLLPMEYCYPNPNESNPHFRNKPWNEATVRAVLRNKTGGKHMVQNKPGTSSHCPMPPALSLLNAENC